MVNILKLFYSLSIGVSFGEQLVYDTERLRSNFPSVSVKIILVDEVSNKG
jgi:hypothetical protein